MVEQYGYKVGDFPVTDMVCRGTIALPFHNNLSADEIDLVCSELKSCLDAL